MKKGKKEHAPSTAPKKKTSRDPHSSGAIPGAKLAGLLGMMGQGGGPSSPPGPMQTGAQGPNPMGSDQTGGDFGPPPGGMMPSFPRKKGRAP
jgi:hypothetical protein